MKFISKFLLLLGTKNNTKGGLKINIKSLECFFSSYAISIISSFFLWLMCHFQTLGSLITPSEIMIAMYSRNTLSKHENCVKYIMTLTCMLMWIQPYDWMLMRMLSYLFQISFYFFLKWKSWPNVTIKKKADGQIMHIIITGRFYLNHYLKYKIKYQHNIRQRKF